ncbi:MAG: 2-dehydro-3-deoxyphosphooctonate aldolase [Chlamydiia bacterium]|nr:2-dehydro-3-deoxyphosphooctonate aldolase [Chlamydiia bacterium]
MSHVSIGKIKVGDKHPLCFVLGPCVIENEEHTMQCAKTLKAICSEIKVPFIFKASYDKANRSSIKSFRGPGLKEGLRILSKVKDTLSVPVTTDIHEPSHATFVADVCDVLQIPAFLCRQTDLLTAAARTGKPINVKKGQFLAPWDMKNVVEKLKESGATDIILTDRGTCFGYNNLVTDPRAIPIMKSLGAPVCFDATHSAQLPGGHGHMTGGQREFIPHLAKVAITGGANMIFMETHPDPENAKCDSATVYPMKQIKELLLELKELYNFTHKK